MTCCLVLSRVSSNTANVQKKIKKISLEFLSFHLFMLLLFHCENIFCSTHEFFNSTRRQHRQLTGWGLWMARIQTSQKIWKGKRFTRLFCFNCLTPFSVIYIRLVVDSNIEIKSYGKWENIFQLSSLSHYWRQANSNSFMKVLGRKLKQKKDDISDRNNE